MQSLVNDDGADDKIEEDDDLVRTNSAQVSVK